MVTTIGQTGETTRPQSSNIVLYAILAASGCGQAPR